jgi:cytochrome c biogenesis protein
LSLPSDHADAEVQPDPDINSPKLGFVGWLRWIWRQLTSMRTALFLLLLLAVAAVPGSLVPQRGADPNGVIQYKTDHPILFPILDKLQVFDTYSSVWFSAIYLLLFISLIGCIIPRAKHHFDALRAKPPRTPVRLSRMIGFTVRTIPAEAAASLTADAAVERGRSMLRVGGYRTITFQNPRDSSVSAERGYLRETGNLVFHSALVGILLAVGFGGGFGYSGERAVVEGQTFVNTLVNYDSFNPGRFVNTSSLSPYSVTLDKLDVSYGGAVAAGQPSNYTAHVTTQEKGGDKKQNTIQVNDPLDIGGTNVYLLSNGYAPEITIKNPSGKTVFQDFVPFLPQDANLTSLGFVKVPDGLAKQVGMIGFFYPTAGASQTAAGAFASTDPDLKKPVLTFNVYTGNLGLNTGAPVSVYSLDTDKMTQIAGPGTSVKSIELKPGESEKLPNGLGSVTFNEVKRFVDFQVNHDPTQNWVFVFALLVLGGLLTSLFVPRRRMWVKAIPQDDGSLRLEYAGLARGDDPNLADAVAVFADKHSSQLNPSGAKELTPAP